MKFITENFSTFTKYHIYRIKFEIIRISHQSLMVLAYKALLKFTGFILGILLLPLTYILHTLGYRHVPIFAERIGHLALEPDCLIKEMILGLKPKRKWILLARPGYVANKHLLIYWEEYFIIIRSFLGWFIISNMSRFGLMRHNVSDYSLNICGKQKSYQVYSTWRDRSPLLKLNSDDEEWGNAMLRKIGLPQNAWFVCVHAREGGFSPVDESLHSHRNCNIENAIPAMEEIIKRGGWVIRIGDPSMKRLRKMDKVIDYAHNPIKSDRLDIILLAKARFVLGNTSGITIVSSVFGIPCALMNMTPICGVLWFNSYDISIPKHVRCQSSNKILNLIDILSSEISSFQFASQFKESGLILEENCAEDIRMLTEEMLNQLDGIFLASNSDLIMQSRVHNLINQKNIPYQSTAKFSINFLKKYHFYSGDSEILVSR